MTNTDSQGQGTDQNTTSVHHDHTWSQEPGEGASVGWSDRKAQANTGGHRDQTLPVTSSPMQLSSTTESGHCPAKEGPVSWEI